jgi:hypothetical protein
MKRALAWHDETVRHAIETHGGYVFSTAGDSFAAAFSDPMSAADAAVEIQQALERVWPGLGVLRVRMALDTGIADERGGDYFGPPVNRASRLMSAAKGGEVLASHTTADLLRHHLEEGIRLVDRGQRQLKGVARSEAVFAVEFGPKQRRRWPVRRRTGIWIAATVVVAAIVAAAGAVIVANLGRESPPTTEATLLTTTTPPTTTTTTPPTTTVVAILLDAPAPDGGQRRPSNGAGHPAGGSGCVPGVDDYLPDGVWFGYVVDVVEAPSRLVFDMACFYEGSPAAAEAAFDGLNAVDGVYVRNTSRLLFTVTVSTEAVVDYLHRDGHHLRAAFADWPLDDGSIQCPGEQCSVWLRVTDGSVKAIQEQGGALNPLP